MGIEGRNERSEQRNEPELNLSGENEDNLPPLIERNNEDDSDDESMKIMSRTMRFLMLKTMT